MCEKKNYPCDIPNENGEFICPFNAEMDSSGYACRNHCGLGVDEDSYPEEPEIDESMNPYDGTYDWENDVVSIGSEDW